MISRDYGSIALDGASFDLYGKSYNDIGMTAKGIVWSRVATVIYGRNKSKGSVEAFNTPSQISKADALKVVYASGDRAKHLLKLLR